MVDGTIVFEATRIVDAPQPRLISRERPELLLEVSARREPFDVRGFGAESLVRTVDDDKPAAPLAQSKIDCRQSRAYVVPIGTFTQELLSRLESPPGPIP